MWRLLHQCILQIDSSLVHAVKFDTFYVHKFWMWIMISPFDYMETHCRLFQQKLTREVPRVFARSRRPFWVTSSRLRKVIWNYDVQRDYEEHMSDFVISAVTADGLAPLVARTSTGTVMTNVGSSIHTGPALGRLTDLPLDKITTITQTTFSDVFSWTKNLVFWLKFLWSLFVRVQLTITQHWFK